MAMKIVFDPLPKDVTVTKDGLTAPLGTASTLKAWFQRGAKELELVAASKLNGEAEYRAAGKRTWSPHQRAAFMAKVAERRAQREKSAAS